MTVVSILILSFTVGTIVALSALGKRSAFIFLFLLVIEVIIFNNITEYSIYKLKSGYEILTNKTNSKYIILYKGDEYTMTDYNEVIKLRNNDFELYIKVKNDMLGATLGKEIIVR